MPITDTEALTRTIEHREIFHDEMLALMRRIMGGEMSPVMMAALLIGLRVKKETIGEITAAAQVMREFSTKVEVADRSTWSTSSAPAATARTPSTSPPARCSSPPGRRARQQARQPQRVEQVGQRRRAGGAGREPGAQAGRHRDRACIADTGIGFMFAPNHHPAMKNVAPVRKRTGRRTIFNILGPLTNPAGAQHPDGRVPPPIWSASRCARCSAWAPSTRWWSTAATAWTRSRWGGHDGGRATGRRHPRVRDPPGGLRPDHGSNRALKVETPSRARPCCARCSTTRPARRATS